MGKFIGVSINVLAWPGKVLKKSAGKLRPLSTREKIRSVVTEELIRFMGLEAEFTSAKLEKRLQVMAEAILALQKKSMNSVLTALSVKQICSKQWARLK